MMEQIYRKKNSSLEISPQPPPEIQKFTESPMTLTFVITYIRTHTHTYTHNYMKKTIILYSIVAGGMSVCIPKSHKRPLLIYIDSLIMQKYNWVKDLCF